MAAVEIFGIFASVLVVVSLTMKNIKWLRIINLAGAACFAVYGTIIKSPAVIIVNVFAVMVNIYHLIGIMFKKRV